jgi:hypothetical protein
MCEFRIFGISLVGNLIRVCPTPHRFVYSIIPGDTGQGKCNHRCGSELGMVGVWAIIQSYIGGKQIRKTPILVARLVIHSRDRPDRQHLPIDSKSMQNGRPS